MKADQTILQFLDAPTRAPAWPVGVDGLYLSFDTAAFFSSFADPLWILL